MIPCSQDYLNSLRSPIKEVYIKFEFYDSKMKYINEFTKQITEDDLGSVNCDSSRPVRRNFSFSLFSKNKEFVFGEDKLIWLDKRIKLYSGLKLRNGTIEYIPQGVYILSEPSDSHNTGGKITTINGQDKMYLFTNRRGCLLNETTLEVGLNIGQAVKILAGKVGETLFNFDTITETVPYTLTYQSGDSIFSAFEELSLLGKCDIFYDVNGYLRLKKIDLNEFERQPSVWKFEFGDSNEKFYAGNLRKLEDTICNHILVLGGSGETAEQRCELIVTDTDPLWANSPYTVEKIGDLLYQHNNGTPDPLLGGTDSAPSLWRAKFELRRLLSFSERLTLTISPHYLLEPNDVIEIIDAENSVVGKYLILSVNIPLKPELMTCECLKYHKVIDNWDFI